MPRDGNREYTLAQIETLAIESINHLDSRRGDPSRHGSWITQRLLAHLLYALVSRIKNSATSVEVPVPQ